VAAYGRFLGAGKVPHRLLLHACALLLHLVLDAASAAARPSLSAAARQLGRPRLRCPSLRRCVLAAGWHWPDAGRRALAAARSRLEPPAHRCTAHCVPDAVQLFLWRGAPLPTRRPRQHVGPALPCVHALTDERGVSRVFRPGRRCAAAGRQTALATPHCQQAARLCLCGSCTALLCRLLATLLLRDARRDRKWCVSCAPDAVCMRAGQGVQGAMLRKKHPPPANSLPQGERWRRCILVSAALTSLRQAAGRSRLLHAVSLMQPRLRCRLFGAPKEGRERLTRGKHESKQTGSRGLCRVPLARVRRGASLPPQAPRRMGRHGSADRA
jgi:hypothetical protein